MAKFDKVIPSGQEGKVHMVIEGKRVHDKFNKSATIRSNDPEHPVMTISMEGNITPFVAIVPNSRIYLQGQYGEKVEKKLTVKSNEDDLDFKITNIESNIDDKITYEYAPTAEKSTWEISVYKNPRLPTLSTYGNLTVYTNSERAPTKTVQVQVITKGAISVEPKSVNFGTVNFGSDGARGEAVTKNVVVIKTTGDFTILDLQFSTDKFVGEIEAVQLGKRYNIRVTFNPPVKKQPRQTHVGEMTIITDDPMEPELKVRLVARSM